jgi:biotin carboxyl carrier protein
VAEVDPRADQAKRLAGLADTVLRAGEAAWHPPGSSQLAKEIEDALHDYSEDAGCAVVGVIPLREPAEPLADGEEDAKPRPAPPVIGALVVESMDGSQSPAELQPRLDLLLPHCSQALAKSLEHDSIFQVPTRRRIGKLRWLVRAPLSWVFAALLAGLIAAFVFVPAEFRMQGKGELRPVLERDVFAPVDGVVTAIKVEAGQKVKQGDELLILENKDLDVRIDAALGEWKATEERLNSVIRMRHQPDLKPEEKNRLAGEALELEQRVASQKEQHQLLLEKQKELTIRSPIDGEIVTWDIERLLQGRPVSAGQAVLAVADPAGPWHLRVFLPENRVGHVTEAQANLKPQLEVEYVAATDPERELFGTLREIETVSSLHEEHGHVVTAFVDIDRNDVVDPRPGATVTAQIHCGTTSLGNYCLHEVYEFVQTEIVFNLWPW